MWLFIGASAVVINDSMAYFCGVFFGKRKLIELSPKKTVEGFVGAFFTSFAPMLLVT